jgi:hypothetical protein
MSYRPSSPVRSTITLFTYGEQSSGPHEPSRLERKHRQLTSFIVRRQLEPIRQEYPKHVTQLGIGWDRCLGSASVDVEPDRVCIGIPPAKNLGRPVAAKGEGTPEIERLFA